MASFFSIFSVLAHLIHASPWCSWLRPWQGSSALSERARGGGSIAITTPSQPDTSPGPAVDISLRGCIDSTPTPAHHTTPPTQCTISKPPVSSAEPGVWLELKSEGGGVVGGGGGVKPAEGRANQLPGAAARKQRSPRSIPPFQSTAFPARGGCCIAPSRTRPL